MTDGRHSMPSRWLSILVLLLTPSSLVRCGEPVASAPLPPATRQTVEFRRDIHPLLSRHCFRCHQGADASSRYRLDVRAELLGEANGKPLVQTGHSERSRLIQLVAGQVA